MTGPLNSDKHRKPWLRYSRFVVYALIILALLLWVQHEKKQSEMARASAIEANLKRQRDLEAEYHRAQAAYALVNRAASIADPVEQLPIYDEIINTYQGDQATSMLRYVSWAIYRKALAVTDSAEKTRLLEEVVNGYCDVPDKQVNSYVMGALRRRLRLVDGRAEKLAFVDEVLEKQGRRLPDSLAAWLLNNKAELISDRAAQIAIYDSMLSRFLSSADDSAFNLAIIAALDQVKLISDAEEQIRLCDIVIEAYLKTPNRTRPYLFERAVGKKAKLVGDPSLPLKLYDQVIADNVTEEAVVQARSMRIPLLKDDNDRLAACDEFITVHQDSQNDFVRLMVARAMARKADLLTEPEAKMALMRSIVEKCADIEDSRARDLANETVVKLAALSGDTASAIRYYDEAADRAESELEAIRALRSKTRLVNDQAEIIRLLDEVIARGENSDDRQVSREITSAIHEKLGLIGDREEKIRLYDELIARVRRSRDTRMWLNVSSLMFDKAGFLENKEAKISLYDEIIADSLSSGNKKNLLNIVRATVEKAKLSDDQEEKTRLYDAALFDATQADDDLFYLFLSGALRERVELETKEQEKLRLYGRFIAVAGEVMKPEIRQALLLDNVELMSDPAGRSRLYGEIIEDCEKSLDASGRGGILSLKEYEKNKIMDNLSKAILGKAGLSERAEDKLKLYDKYLALPQADHTGLMSLNFEQVISKKIELADDSSLDSAERSRLYDGIIERCELRLNAGGGVVGASPLNRYDLDLTMINLGKAIISKADLLQNVEDRLKLYDRYLALPQVGRRSGFLNASLEEILSQKAAAVGDPAIISDYFDEKIRAAATDGERVDWYARKAEAAGKNDRAAVEDEIIVRFFDIADNEVEGAVAGIFLKKIRRISYMDEQSRLCDRLIERYQNSGDDQALYAVVQVFGLKADATEDEAARIELYSKAIDRYKGNKNFLVKKAVNEAVAARFRLEMKRNE